jgi:hypothetical protein
MGFQAKAQSGSWTYQSLLSQKVLHDGPNCFNAVLLAKGFMADITYVDTLEFSYYIDNFCRPIQSKKFEEGNILVYLGHEPSPFVDESDSMQILHGALSLGHGLIFEKTSNSGSLFGEEDDRHKPGQYKIKKIKESAFALKSSGVRVLKEYVCAGKDQVLARVAALNSDVLARRINALRLKFDNPMAEVLNFDSKKIQHQLQDIIESLKERPGIAEYDLYILAVSRSLTGSFGSVLLQNDKYADPELMKVLQELEEVNAELQERVRQTTKDSKVIRMLDKSQIN